MEAVVPDAEPALPPRLHQLSRRDRGDGGPGDGGIQQGLPQLHRDIQHQLKHVSSIIVDLWSFNQDNWFRGFMSKSRIISALESYVL